MNYTYIIFLAVIILASWFFYKKGMIKGKYNQVFLEKYNYQIRVKSNQPLIDKKYKFYNWDVNISQTIMSGDHIVFDSENIKHGLIEDYQTIDFTVIERKLVEKQYKGVIHLLVKPIYDLEQQTI